MELSPLTDIEKRKAIYASLLRYTSETDELRTRVLERIILAGLIGVTNQSPVRISRLLENAGFCEIRCRPRDHIVRIELEKLISEGKVDCRNDKKGKPCYWLTESGNSYAESITSNTEPLIDKVVRRRFTSDKFQLHAEHAAFIFRRFLFECFSRFGKTLALSVSGRVATGEVAGRIEFKKVIGEVFTSSNVKSYSQGFNDALTAECTDFLRSRDSDDEKLKFHLVQGHYFAQLLGYDHSAHIPLSREAFFDTEILIDANVIIASLLEARGGADFISEIQVLGKQCGIKFSILRETINEIERVAKFRQEQIERIYKKVNPMLIENTKDAFINAYEDARKENNSILIEEFFAPFLNLEERLRSADILIIELETESLPSSEQVATIRRDIAQSHKSQRGWEKTGEVLEHDVLILWKVLEIQKEGGKARLLTRDLTLVDAARKVSQDGQSFVFSLLGFVQSISPFVPANDGSVIEDVFNMVLAWDFSDEYKLFDIDELDLLGEMHEDIMATPDTQLTLALQEVKKNVLKGNPYRKEDTAKVALALRKHLKSSSDDKIGNLSAQVLRLSSELESEISKSEAIANEGKIKDKDNEALGNRIENLESQFNLEKVKNVQRMGEILKSRTFDRFLVFVVFSVFWVFVWFFMHEIMNESIKVEIGLVLFGIAGLSLFSIRYALAKFQNSYSGEIFVFIVVTAACLLIGVTASSELVEAFSPFGLFFGVGMAVLNLIGRKKSSSS